ncbi:FeMo cofactor biosynthesis protein [Desulfonema limicola]|uniref:FeMo cofactor biosynthesis protein NifB n=1 Tax=Desulfonema limicola TaxID=45656 RepID=A0A975BDE9_9BACT|nr:radical SAM protein [Desulfonema limicola]QTA83401.1 FeMo cofactor biosynthesis protein [Desulfonema limicola]
MNFENHPCFNAKAHKAFGRVHLPVAPRCNIQCKFCNRKFDCVNESRPGVSSGILTPYQAMIYLEEVFKQKKNISVAGIAGPGDPFANPEETMETLRLVRAKYPDIMLCVATNGLSIAPYIDELAELKVSHVTITVNALETGIGTQIYSWVRYNKRVLRAEKGVEILMKNQIQAIKKLKDRNIAVKVNTIIIPGINEDHIEAVAAKMSELGVDILNCVPYYPNKGSSFEHIKEPSKEMVKEIRKKAGAYISQMTHCTRCRADAAGLLGDIPDLLLMKRLQECEQLAESRPEKKYNRDRPNVAVASMEGVLVNQHLGEASKLLIYGKKDGIISLLEARKTPERGTGFLRWTQLGETLADCGTLLVSGIGESPKKALSTTGINIMEIEGVIDEAVQAVFEGQSLKHLIKRNMTACGLGCTGSGAGCG